MSQEGVVIGQTCNGLLLLTPNGQVLAIDIDWIGNLTELFPAGRVISWSVYNLQPVSN